MTSRMDRYENNKNSNSSRLAKNKELYEHLYTNSSYTEFTDINSSNVMDLTSNTTNKEGRRENYQRQRKFTDSLGNDNDESIFRYNEYSYHQIIEPNTKDYDINSVLEKARKNRVEVDELEKKRKLRTTEYNILADLTAEKLKEHKEKKKEVLTKEEEDELEELIHTITSNTMRQEIDDELLSNLMPTELDETIVSQDLSEMLLVDDNNVAIDSSSDIEKKIDDTESTLSKIDDSFYTKSMDLSDRDFIDSYDYNDEEDNSFQEYNNKKGIVIKVLITIAIIVLIAVVGVILYNVL